MGLALVPGETVGNRSAGFPGEAPMPGRVDTLPGSGGSVAAGRVGLGGWLAELCGLALISTVAAA